MAPYQIMSLTLFFLVGRIAVVDIGIALSYAVHKNLFLTQLCLINCASLSAGFCWGVRLGGIEPPASAWKANVLPLHHRRLLFGQQRVVYKLCCLSHQALFQKRGFFGRLRPK